MNAHAQTSAVAGSTTARSCEVPKKPRKSRARFAWLFDMADEKEREVCRRVSFFHRGGDYTAVEFRRTTGTDGERMLWAVVDNVPRWRDRYRWTIVSWNIDTGRIGFHDCRTREAAVDCLNSLTLN
jgi:hypothetical protein